MGTGPFRRIVLILAALAPIGPLAAAAQDGDAKVVAVLRFENNTGDDQYDQLGRALSTMTISDLSVLDQIRLVERQRLEELLGELELQQSPYVDPSTAQNVGLILGAEYVVAGAFAAADPQIRLDTRVARVETSEIVSTADVTGERDALFDLQQKLADQLLEGFEVVLGEEDRVRLRERQEANRIDDIETVLRFSYALCLLDHGAYVEGLEEMEEVRSRAPGSQIVNATFDVLKERAADELEDRAKSEVNRRIGGLLGRRSRDPEPRRVQHPC